MPPNTTARAMTAEHLPKGTRPEEFLSDHDLPGYYERELAALPEGSKKRPALVQALRQARVGRALAEIAASEPPEVVE